MILRHDKHLPAGMGPPGRPIRRRHVLFGCAMGLLGGCGGGGDPAAAGAEPLSSTALLPPAPLPTVKVNPPQRARALAVGDGRLIGSPLTDSALRPEWVYYTDPSGQRWYISPIDVFTQAGNIYSLGPLVGDNASWWPVGDKAMRGDASTLRLRAGSGLSRNTTTSFIDAGRGVQVTDARIFDDRRRIESANVPIKWYFTLGRDGAWYIVGEPGYVGSGRPVAYQFAAADGNYDWRPVNLDGTVLLVDWKDNRPALRMQPVAGWAEKVVGQSINMDGAYGAQCVDLFHHYLDAALGIPFPHGFTGDAYPIFQEAANSTVKISSRLGPVTFTKHLYRAGDRPAPGDIVFWSAPNPGHVAIVLSADTKTLTTMDQNWVNSSANGSPAARVVHPDYDDVAGWLRPTW